jgi:hypothetical protein
MLFAPVRKPVFEKQMISRHYRTVQKAMKNVVITAIEIRCFSNRGFLAGIGVPKGSNSVGSSGSDRWGFIEDLQECTG